MAEDLIRRTVSFIAKGKKALTFATSEDELMMGIEAVTLIFQQ